MANNTDKVGLCIVGCGDIAKAHASSLQQKSKRVDLYFASRTREKAAQYAEAYGGLDAFGSYQAAAEDPRVDSLLFCTPHSLHRENAEMAASCGKNILMEKPIATTVDDAIAMQKAAERAGVKFMVSENFRYMPVVRACADMLNQGAIGTLRSLHFQAFGYYLPQEWRRSLKMRGGGSLIDGGIHYVAALRVLGGMTDWVSAATPPKLFPEIAGAEEISLIAGFSSGAIGTITYSEATVGERGRQMAWVLGTEGHITFDFNKLELSVATSENRRTVSLEGEGNGVSQEQDAFLDLVTEQRPVLSTPQEGTGDLALVLAAYESAKSGGQPIHPTPNG